LVRRAKIKTLNTMSRKQLTKRQSKLEKERSRLVRDLKGVGRKTKTARKLRRRRDKIDVELRKTKKARKKKK
jgi:hypothetical protein